MHRPTRQHRNLEAKLAQKRAVVEKHGRKPGSKIKRWTKWLAQYAPLREDQDSEA